MASKQTEQLRSNIQSQIDRLVNQLADLDAEKGSLGDDEYEEMRGETLAEMEVFQKQMDKMCSGDMSLMTEFQSAQLVRCLFFFFLIFCQGHSSCHL